MKKIFALFFCAVLLVLALTSIFAQGTSESIQTVFVSDIPFSSDFFVGYYKKAKEEY